MRSHDLYTRLVVGRNPRPDRMTIRALSTPRVYGPLAVQRDTIMMARCQGSTPFAARYMQQGQF
jgi:hypothetical protein